MKRRAPRLHSVACRLNVYLDAETRHAVREAADRAELSDSAWVREVLQDTLMMERSDAAT